MKFEKWTDTRTVDATCLTVWVRGEHLDPDITPLMTQLFILNMQLFLIEKGILSKMKSGQCDMTPSSNLISPGCLRSECPSLCPAHMDRAHLSLSHRSPGRAGAGVTPPPPPRLRHQEPALTRVSYHPDTDGDRWRDDGQSDIWDNMKKWWEFPVSHCRHRGTWGGGMHYLINERTLRS